MTELRIPNVLEPGSIEDISKVQENFGAVRTALNGTLDPNNFAAASIEPRALSVRASTAAG